jgi:hypothetical protein
MSVRREIITRIDRWCAEFGVRLRQHGYRAVKSCNAFRHLRIGQSVTLDTMDRLITYIAAHPTAADQPTRVTL